MWSRAGRMPIEVMGGPSKPIAYRVSNSNYLPSFQRWKDDITARALQRPML